MSNEPIYVDAAKAAVLHHRGTSINCPTLQEAVIEFHSLPPDRREIAEIQCDRKVYSAAEIERLHYGPKPEDG
jgi:hypothetical protein